MKTVRIALFVFIYYFQKREGPSDMGATATVEIDTGLDNDAQAIFEKAREINEVCYIISVMFI